MVGSSLSWRYSSCFSLQVKGNAFLISPWCPLIFLSKLLHFQQCSRHVHRIFCTDPYLLKSPGWMDVPKVMIQTGPNGEDPVIEVPNMGRWTTVWAGAKRWVSMGVSRLWGCWLLVSVWDCLRKTRHALQSEGTVFTHNILVLRWKHFNIFYKSSCRMLRIQAAQSWRLPVHGLFGSVWCQELRGQVGDVSGQPEFVWTLF